MDSQTLFTALRSQHVACIAEIVIQYEFLDDRTKKYILEQWYERRLNFEVFNFPNFFIDLVKERLLEYIRNTEDEFTTEVIKDILEIDTTTQRRHLIFSINKYKHDKVKRIEIINIYLNDKLYELTKQKEKIESDLFFDEDKLDNINIKIGYVRELIRCNLD